MTDRHERFLLTAFTAARAAERDTVPVFAEFLIVRLFDGASLDEALATADLDTFNAVFSPAPFQLAMASLPVDSVVATTARASQKRLNAL